MTETHPEKPPFGYARVSTYGQTLDAQLDQLRAAGYNISPWKWRPLKSDTARLSRPNLIPLDRSRVCNRAHGTVLLHYG